MPPSRDEELARLRDRPDNVHIARGYGPLVVGVVLFVLVVLLAPTVAPERVVERPVNGEPTTTLVTTTTSTPSSDSTTSTTPTTPTTVAP